MFSNIEDCIRHIRQTGVEVLDFKVVDLWGRWRQVSAPAGNVSHQMLQEGFGFDASNYGFLAVEKSDMVLVPDPSTAFEEEWEGMKVISFICGVHMVEGDEPRFGGDPRFICEKAQKYISKKGLADYVRLLPELEFYVFDKACFGNSPFDTFYKIESGSIPGASRANSGYFVRPGKGYHVAPPQDDLYGYRLKLVRLLEKSGVKVKYHHHEVGACGQLEIEIDFESPVKSADNVMMTKYMARNLACGMNKFVTFMPKPIYGEAGNGMHVHFKLYRNNENIFSDPGGYGGLSDEARYFIGGILTHAPGLMAFTNPSTNSYKRLVPGYEAPVNLVFATSNRSAAVRIPGYAKSADDRRFEYRPPDATCNPYLAFAALLMAGADGIINRIDPTEGGFGPYDVNLYNLPEDERKKIKNLPYNMEESMNALSGDYEYLLMDGVFDKNFIDHWIKVKTAEEIIPLRQRPHPYEFHLYNDI